MRNNIKKAYTIFNKKSNYLIIFFHGADETIKYSIQIERII